MNYRASISSRPRLLQRSPDGWFFGVCGGLAEYFGFRAWAVRLIALISFFVFFPVPLLIYAMLVLIMRRAPTARERFMRVQF